MMDLQKKMTKVYQVRRKQTHVLEQNQLDLDDFERSSPPMSPPPIIPKNNNTIELDQYQSFGVAPKVPVLP